MIRCAITDGSFRPGDGERWAADGVAYVQLRDKTLGAGALADLARAILQELGASPTQLLVNGRADVAAAAGAAGVHLTAHPDELTPEQVRRVFALAGRARPWVSVSCHSTQEVQRAREAGADMVLFGPVFEKRVGDVVVSGGVGLEALREACAVAGEMPVLALGGVIAENYDLCLITGATGVAGIRLFA